NYTDLRKTTFERCTFLGVDFHYSDLRGLRLDGQTFVGVTFDLPSLKDVSFQGATLKKVSFRPVGLWSMRRAIQSIHFDGAMMDKLTYAALKGVGADVSKATILS
ncbi:MAG TPA: pentapeptide repeat-containing protein, partial [Ktedonobacteraceae bacterium]|nr:pentapeptide repeat-containing protein [Ktedonobacteraceae bacterium]